MKSKQPSRQQLLSSCNDIGPDDGVDPRLFFRQPSRQRSNRKARQMCGEIARTVNLVLAWETGDDLLRSLVVEAVEPAPDSSRVLVTVCRQDPVDTADVSQILERLHRSSGRFRTEIAAAIHRRKVPELAFRVVGRSCAPSTNSHA